MPRAGLSRPAVVDAALRVVDECGPTKLSLAAVAGHAGVATPSLYKHVANLAELVELVAARCYDELADATTEAIMGRSGDDAVRAILHAYRGYALAHPHRYPMLPPLPAHPDGARAGERVVDTFRAVLRGYGLTGSAAIHAIRGMRAAAHGFVCLEIAGGFGLPESLDDSYRRLVDSLLAGLPKGVDQ